jgi:hypothetical protein
MKKQSVVQREYKSHISIKIKYCQALLKCWLLLWCWFISCRKVPKICWSRARRMRETLDNGKYCQALLEHLLLLRYWLSSQRMTYKNFKLLLMLLTELDFTNESWSMITSDSPPHLTSPRRGEGFFLIFAGRGSPLPLRFRGYASLQARDDV